MRGTPADELKAQKSYTRDYEGTLKGTPADELKAQKSHTSDNEGTLRGREVRCGHRRT